MHENNIMHLNIHPDNIYIKRLNSDENSIQVIIGNFGSSL